MLTKKCEQCKKSFSKPYHESLRFWNRRRFCSKKCWGNFKKGKPGWNKNRKMDDYPQMGFQKGNKLWNNSKTKATQFKKGENVGEKNSGWIVDRSFLIYPDEWTETLRESIRIRDNYMCQMCGIHQDELKGFTKKLDCHHIDYNKDNLNPDNLISLCRVCHTKTSFNRKYWTNYFHIIS